MSDYFDDIAQRLGVTRDSAVRSYCPDAYREMEYALHLVCEMVRRASPELTEAMTERLTELLANAEISTAATLAIHALRDYQTDTD